LRRFCKRNPHKILQSPGLRPGFFFELAGLRSNRSRSRDLQP